MREVPDNLIHKAVDIWCKKLYAPVFDNGDDSALGGMASALAMMNIQSAKLDDDEMNEKVEVFRKALTDALILERDSGERGRSWLDVDYHPCKLLADAAEIAGIPKSLFSIKSSVSINNGYVSTSFGYAADYICHYPFDDNKWLVTSLRGSDIPKVIEHVKSGNSAGFQVDIDD
jgi:hypothetical protein